MNNLIEIDGVTYSNCIVLMLTSNEIAKAGDIIRNGGKLRILSEEDAESNIKNKEYLYFLTTDRVNKYDWRIDIHMHDPKPVQSEASYESLMTRKIIATTDSKCNKKMYHSKGSTIEYLPKPSEFFIKLFVDEYNKGHLIKNMLVEYDHYPASGSEQAGGWIKEPVINPEDNTISTLLLPKESWGREEVKALLNKVMNLGMTHRQDQLNGHSDMSGNEKLEDWIKENL